MSATAANTYQMLRARTSGLSCTDPAPSLHPHEGGTVPTLILWVGNARPGRLSHRPKAQRVGIWARVWPQSQCFWQCLQTVFREKVSPQTSTVPCGSAVKKKKRRKKERKKKKKTPAWRCGFNPWSGRSPAEGNGNTPLQFSCLGNLTDGGAWWATVHGVAKVRHDLRLNNKSYHSVTPLQRTRRKVSKQPSPFAILKTDQILSSPLPLQNNGMRKKRQGPYHGVERVRQGPRVHKWNRCELKFCTRT